MGRRCLAEAFGTFCVVFAGTAAVIENQGTNERIGHVGVALTFGMVVFVMVASLARRSGAHLNPAVTLGLVFAKRFPSTAVFPYILSQIAGAFVASLVLRSIAPAHSDLGCSLPSIPVLGAWMVEFILTLILMFVILSVSDEVDDPRLAGLVVGSVIAMEALFAGPMTGASMNPARSLAPALVSGNLTSLWIYMVAPVLGALGGVILHRWIQQPGTMLAESISQETSTRLDEVSAYPSSHSTHSF